MTNEEMAIRIQDGEADLYGDLWENNRKLIFQIMMKKLHNAILPCYISIEDLEQEMYFALLQAVRYYDRDKPYSFTTYLNYPILKVLTRLVFNDKSIKKECSFDTKIADNDGKTVEKWDLFPDFDSEKEYDNIENEDLSDKVRQAVAALKDRERTAVELYFFHGHTYEEIALLLHVSKERVRQIIVRAIRRLRHNPAIRQSNLERKLHQYKNEEKYRFYADQWRFSQERSAAEVELSRLIQEGKYLSYGKRVGFMQLAKDRYISARIKEAQTIRQAVHNRFLP